MLSINVLNLKKKLFLFKFEQLIFIIFFKILKNFNRTSKIIIFFITLKNDIINLTSENYFLI
jgi:hypothetical protein